MAYPGLRATWGMAGHHPQPWCLKAALTLWPQLHHKWPFALATLISVQVSWLRQAWGGGAGGDRASPQGVQTEWLSSDPQQSWPRAPEGRGQRAEGRELPCVSGPSGIRRERLP